MIDEEVATVETPLRIRIRPKALKALAPASDARQPDLSAAGQSR